jgi:hypothetical protein
MMNNDFYRGVTKENNIFCNGTNKTEMLASREIAMMVVESLFDAKCFSTYDVSMQFLRKSKFWNFT